MSRFKAFDAYCLFLLLFAIGTSSFAGEEKCGPDILKKLLRELAFATPEGRENWLNNARKVLRSKNQIDAEIEEKLVAIALSKEGAGNWPSEGEKWIYNAPESWHLRVDRRLNQYVREGSAAPSFDIMSSRKQNAQELVIITHQVDVELANQTAAFLNSDPSLKEVPRLALVDLNFPLQSQKLRREVSGALFSMGGEISRLPKIDKLHLMGGYSRDCLSQTFEDVLKAFLREPSQKELEVILHSDFIYTENGTLAQNIASKRVDAKKLHTFLDDFLWEFHEEELGLELTSDNDGLVFRHNETGKVLRVKIKNAH